MVRNDGQYLTVSQFAKLCKVTPRTLKYYEEMGLLQPAKTVPHTGYRLYEPTQADEVSMILVFKEHGFSLKEIASMDFGNNLEAIKTRLLLQKEMIEDKRRELEEREKALEGSLFHINRALEHLEEVTEGEIPCQRLHIDPLTIKKNEVFYMNSMLDGSYSGICYDLHSLNRVGVIHTRADGEYQVGGKGLQIYHKGAPALGNEALYKIQAEAMVRGYQDPRIFCIAVFEDVKPENCIFWYFCFA